MKNPTPPIDHIYQMQVEEYGGYPSIDADLFTSIYHESTVKLPGDPLHNSSINFYNHHEDDKKNRPRDTKIYFPSRVYHFYEMREAVVLENHLSAAAQTPSCSMYISWPDEATRDLLLVCCEISKHQPVTALYMGGVTCDDSSLTAPRMINPQVLHLYKCNLPSNFVENLIQQLKGSGDSLQRLELDMMDLSPYGSLLDELLENLVGHHETHKCQRKLELWLKYKTNLSEGFRVKWKKRCEGVESIHCWISPWLGKIQCSFSRTVDTNQFLHSVTFAFHQRIEFISQRSTRIKSRKKFPFSERTFFCDKNGVKQNFTLIYQENTSHFWEPLVCTKSFFLPEVIYLIRLHLSASAKAQWLIYLFLCILFPSKMEAMFEKMLNSNRIYPKIPAFPNKLLTKS